MSCTRGNSLSTNPERRIGRYNRTISSHSKIEMSSELNSFSSKLLSETATHTLKSVRGLLQDPLDDPGIVVTETKVVIQGREAVSLA